MIPQQIEKAIERLTELRVLVLKDVATKGIDAIATDHPLTGEAFNLPISDKWKAKLQEDIQAKIEQVQASVRDW